MKIQNTYFGVFILSLLFVSCNRNLPDELITSPIEEEDYEYKWWILKHRNFQDPGIFLYNELTSTIELELDLPEDLQSPHAIAFDGTSLWVGGNGENESIYELNPENGNIISKIANTPTEALTVDDDFLYYADLNIIKIIEKNGSLVDEILTKNTTLNIPDIAINGSDLYYLRYSEDEPIVGLNLTSNTEYIKYGIENNDTYCLSIINNEIITVSTVNEINHNYLQTGGYKSSHPTDIKGWITAIAPYYEN